MYLLFDCNNFFASCEQVFRPDWRHRPLVVLSNNDGCVVSRSQEAKQMGIAMGEPYFKCRERLEQAGGIACSANFALYSNLSDRIMQILEESLPELHQYSIDEAFAIVSQRSHCDWLDECRKIRHKIRRWTGITVSVGLAPTKTLAKLANELAKKNPEYKGVLHLPADCDSVLRRTPIEDIWGVGRRLAPRMHGLGIRTAAGLAAASLDWLRQRFGVHGERLALELRGVSCLEDEPVNTRSQVMVSRSLKEGIEDETRLREALCGFVEKAARILRSGALMASQVYVVLRTSRYAENSQLYAAQQGCLLPHPTDDTRLFVKAATELLKALYRPGYPYRKIGVLLADLQETASVQPTFDHPQVAPNPLMQVLDKLQREGHQVHFANKAAEPLWRCSQASPCYTTRWADIPEAW